MNVALIAARGTIYAAVKAAISSHTSGIFCLVIGIFSLISLFFATIGGTKAIENHRDSNVSVWFVWHSNLETSWRSNSLTVSCGGAFFLFIYLFFLLPVNNILCLNTHHRVARMDNAIRDDRTVQVLRKSLVPIFVKSIVWGMRIAQLVVDEPGNGVAFSFSSSHCCFGEKEG